MIDEMSEIELIATVFSKIPDFGKVVFIVGIMAFIYTTILGWSYYGEKCAEYLFGYKIRGAYQVIFAVVLIVSSIFEIEKVKVLSDFFNAMLVIPNILSLFLLSSLVRDETKKYLKFPNRKI